MQVEITEEEWAWLQQKREEIRNPPHEERMVQVCPMCRKPVWGEGGNPMTGVQFFSHTTRENSNACCEEIEIHPGEEIPYGPAPKVDSKEDWNGDKESYGRKKGSK